VLRPRYRWSLRAQGAPSGELLAAGRRLGLSVRTVGILAGRGHGEADLAGFVRPAVEALHDPALLPDADAAVERIGAAVRRGERVMVFGDFDADGLTGLALLTIALRRLGLDVDTHVPGRVADGHGLSRRAVEAAASAGCGLIVTVDCGTASGDEIAMAAQRGIDVIVTDHHHVPAILPGALAVVNPQRPGSRYPDARISGAGVAFKLAHLLLQRLGPAGGNGPGPGPDGLELAELAAIGTVADVAPLVGENRAIVRLGLERMRQRPRPGIAALLERAGVGPERVDVETLGYVVAPRLNAAGRVGDAADAAGLLLTDDPGEAASLAERLDASNTQRRAILATALEEARARVAAEGLADAPVVTVSGPWSPGIIGLVAGRLAEEARRPAVVASTEVEPWRVSARSAGGFHLAAAFESCAELLERHGGHREAAGCTLDPGSWEAFRTRLAALAAALPPPDPSPVLLVDAAVPGLEVDYRLLRELAILDPTGAGNPEALLAVEGLEVVRAREVTGGHSQLTLRKGIEVLDAIVFDRADAAASVTGGDRVDVVARLSSRVFGGFESLQLDVRDLAPSGSAPWSEVRSEATATPAGAAGASEVGR
jgi:single-stranded-DNA-specific exonuclease